MKHLVCILCVIFFAAQEITLERPTEEETKQVQEIADVFERRMRETRDVAMLNDLFINDYVRLQMDEQKASRARQPLELIPSIPLSMKAELASQVAQRHWQRFHTTHFNLTYYFILLVASRFEAESDLGKAQDELTQKIFPVEVLKVLRTDPLLRGHYGVQADKARYTIETVDELQSLINTFEQVTAILRQNFARNPPESTPIYQKNMRVEAAKNAVRKRSIPDVYGTRETRLGFPVGTRFFHTITADSLFELWLVKTDRGIKITRASVYPFN